MDFSRGTEKAGHKCEKRWELSGRVEENEYFAHKTARIGEVRRLVCVAVETATHKTERLARRGCGAGDDFLQALEH